MMVLRRRARQILFCSLLWLPVVPAPGRAGADDLPRVAVLATGGTIASRGSGSAALSADELVGAVPELASIAGIQTEQVLSLASDRILPEHWLRLAGRINALLSAEVDGVVLTHGTDTLEETAYFLNLVVKSAKPVVVVGAMRRASALSADGPANLLNAVKVAATPAARNRGVLVVLNDEIHAARDVTKTHSMRLDTFRSRTFGPLGTIDNGVVRFFRNVERRHTTRAPFDVSKVPPSGLPRVDVVYVYVGADGDAIDAAVEHGAKGIVVAGTGSGGIAPAQREALARAVARRVVVVVASRTGSGPVFDVPAPFIAADDLLPHKARILLMLGLLETSEPEAIRRLFAEY